MGVATVTPAVLVPDCSGTSTLGVPGLGILTFGTSREAMLVALLGLSPFGEAVLSTGIYTVALKKLKTQGLSRVEQQALQHELETEAALLSKEVLRHRREFGEMAHMLYGGLTASDVRTEDVTLS